MSIPDKVLPESPPGDRSAAPATLHATRPLYWAMRRELWENRSLYIVPLIVAALVLIAYVISATRTQHRPPAAAILSALDPVQQGLLLAVPYGISALAVINITIIVACFYCLDALYGERRDRSILFWKSLPVSDFTTVLAKLSMPFVVLPAMTLAIIIGMHLALLLLQTAFMSADGAGAAILWAQLPMLKILLSVLYALPAFALWYAPIYGWLLLVSAWAQRSTFLWAVLPPLGLCAAEKLALDSSSLYTILNHRLWGALKEAFAFKVDIPAGALAERAAAAGGKAPRPQPIIDMIPDPTKFLGNPDLWIGLGIAAACIVAVVWLRRSREPV